MRMLSKYGATRMRENDGEVGAIFSAATEMGCRHSGYRAIYLIAKGQGNGTDC
jgi:hypothetical protein